MSNCQETEGILRHRLHLFSKANLERVTQEKEL